MLQAASGPLLGEQTTRFTCMTVAQIGFRTVILEFLGSCKLM